jgi:hypothetical protein
MVCKPMYKVLKRNETGKLVSPIQNFEYIPGKEYYCQDFDTDRNRECSHGFYATDIDGLIYSFHNLPGYEVWEVEVGGRKVEIDQFKRRYERIKLIRQVPNEEVKELALALEPKVGYKLSEALFPVNPFKIKAQSVTEQEIELLKRWILVSASVRALVGASVWDLVWDSVRDSVSDLVSDLVWESVIASVNDSVSDLVWESVWDSILDSVSAYVSSLFPNIKKWKHIDHPIGENPFQPAIDLWHRGFVPSFDGKTWRLHTGENAEIV